MCPSSREEEGETDVDRQGGRTRTDGEEEGGVAPVLPVAQQVGESNAAFTDYRKYGNVTTALH